MKLLAFLLAFIQPGQQDPVQVPDPNVAQYQNIALGMKFTYPKAWELVPGKNGESKLLIPIKNTSDRAVVEIKSVSFRSEKEIWQLSQVGFNKTAKRTIERQWEEEILSVPVLLTKVNYDEKGSSKTSETGLLYTFGFNKMMYRVTSSPEMFEKADYAWRQVLQSLRTWDGEMPKVEDPSKPIARKDPKAIDPRMVDEVPHPQVPHEINATPKVPIVKAPKGATFEMASKKLELRLPSDWKADPDKDASFNLHSSGMTGTIHVTVFSVAGSDPITIALYKLSGQSLNEYNSVTNREESLAKPNRAGTPIAWIWRTGKGAKGDLATCDASGQCGDYYFLLSYRTDNASHAVGDRKAIDALLNQMSIELVP